MKKILFSLFIIICPLFLFNMSAWAQRGTKVSRGNYVRTLSSENDNSWFGRYEKKHFNQVGLSAGISTMGISLELVTTLSSRFDVRGGINYMPPLLRISDDITVQDDVLRDRVGGYYPDYRVKFKPNLINGHILFDFYPKETSTFRIVAGTYIGRSELRAEGVLVNPETKQRSVLVDQTEGWPNLIVDGRSVNIDKGRLDANIRMGGVIKPYVGVGFGHTIPGGDKSMTMNWDIGVVIQTTHSIWQDGVKADKVTDYGSDAIDIDKYVDAVKVWPMVRMQFSFKLK